MHTQETLEQLRTVIEKLMLELPPENSATEHKQYLAGYIDCLADTNNISEELREILYTEYAY